VTEGGNIGRTEWRAESMTASMTDGRTHELRWREEKRDNSRETGDRMIGWGIIDPRIFPDLPWALGLFPTANRYPLTAKTRYSCFLIKTYLTQE
jgi:hypothetical protein